MSVFDHSRDFLKRHYVEVEKLRRAVWEELENVEHELEQWGELKEEDRTVPAWAAYDGKVLRIVINDYLPKRTDVLHDKSLGANWTAPVTNAIRDLNKRLGYQVEFQRVLCVIVAYLPRLGQWDPDNRAVGKAINGLRYGGVVKKDTWDKLVYMVIGRVSRKRPRTEIYIVEQDEMLPVILESLNIKEETDSEFIRKNDSYSQPPNPTNKPPESFW